MCIINIWREGKKDCSLGWYRLNCLEWVNWPFHQFILRRAVWKTNRIIFFQKSNFIYQPFLAELYPRICSNEILRSKSFHIWGSRKTWTAASELDEELLRREAELRIRFFRTTARLCLRCKKNDKKWCLLRLEAGSPPHFFGHERKKAATFH